MDAKTITGAGMIIGGGLLGYRSMKELSNLGCYGPAGFLTLGLTAVGGGLYLFGKLRGEAVGEATQAIKDDIAGVMGAEVEYAGIPVIADSYGDNSAEGGHGVPQWYGSAETEVGLPVVPNSYGEESTVVDSGHGVPQWIGSAEFEANGRALPRKRVTDRWGNKRYISRRKDGTIRKNVSMGRSLAMDRRKGAVNYARAGFRDQGDAKPMGVIGRVSRDLENMIYGADAIETQKEPVIANSFGDNSALDSGNGVPQWYGSAEFEAPRTRMTLQDGTRRYVRRNSKGQFTKYQVNVDGKKGAAAIDRRKKATSYARAGYRDQGDASVTAGVFREMRNAEFEAPRTRMTLQDGTRRYVRRNNKGQFTKYQVNVDGKKGAIANDRRQKARNYAKPGYRDQGDASPSSGQMRQR